MTTRTSGVFEEGTAPPLTSPSIAMPAMDFVVQWNRCGITADYLADYLSYAFERRDVARSVITTAANELLENAAKFSSDKKAPVRIAARLRGDVLELEVENVADADHVDALTSVLDALSRGEASSLFASRIESAERGGLGLIILARDYDAQLGARIVSVNGGSLDKTFSVTVRASIAADEVEQR
jgi:hypothetical protein